MRLSIKYCMIIHFICMQWLRTTDNMLFRDNKMNTMTNPFLNNKKVGYVQNSIIKNEMHSHHLSEAIIFRHMIVMMLHT